MEQSIDAATGVRHAARAQRCSKLASYSRRQTCRPATGMSSYVASPVGVLHYRLALEGTDTTMVSPALGKTVLNRGALSRTPAQMPCARLSGVLCISNDMVMVSMAVLAAPENSIHDENLHMFFEQCLEADSISTKTNCTTLV